MQLSKEEIQHIANLARLDLTEEELEKYGSQLSNVLSYIDQLKEVDVTDTEPTAQVTGLKNVFRSDEIGEWNKKEVEDALNQAPDFENGQYKVKRVLE
ncbi:MAG: Asp-tRNA(Asn)/Glu-tRNA(Gln) amidotransferase subunit GatC [Patescibacteria group bacterium]|nr:Asp-tRNA(Asn)/Glu-tRNA(Gln) amidotransferase subunit GatC [Patescibacteria group bacterium]MDD4611275.1 Asp-tRNA(Asn)/Glu-tRNA(Gln) amidotransferase subunit GatC [Patescibacteria group bacterium]